MELSYFLAQLFGLSLCVFALAALMRPQFINAVLNDFEKNATVTLLFSFSGILGGLAVILSHNVWTADWPVIITLFGWAAVIKGVAYLVMPKMILGLGTAVYGTGKYTKIILLLAFMLGIYLASNGFGY